MHSSTSVKDWFNENHVPLLPMPPCSPDINVIENVWAYLEKVYDRSVVIDHNSLFEELRKCWRTYMRNITLRLGLINSMQIVYQK